MGVCIFHHYDFHFSSTAATKVLHAEKQSNNLQDQGMFINFK